MIYSMWWMGTVYPSTISPRSQFCSRAHWCITGLVHDLYRHKRLSEPCAIQFIRWRGQFL